MKEMFDDWVRTRTLQNWKFWIFSILMQPLLESYSSSLSSSTYEDLWQCVHNWVDHHCSLALFRPSIFQIGFFFKLDQFLTDFQYFISGL